MAKEEILIEWRDSWDKRKRVAWQRVRWVLKIVAWLLPPVLVVEAIMLWLFSYNVPGADPSWAVIRRQCVDAAIGIACFLVLALVVLVAVTLMPTRHGLAENGLKFNGRFYRWNRIRGYRVDEKANEFGERIIRILPRTWSLPMYLQFPVPHNIPFDNLLECVSAAVPLSQEEDLFEKMGKEQRRPLAILFATIWTIAAGGFLCQFDFSTIAVVLFLVMMVVGPGTFWFAGRFPYLLRKPFWLWQASHVMNQISATVAMYIWLIVSTHRMMNH